MKFSIIMASYNQKDFIEQSILSVLDQSYQNFELIIVDGLSTDGSQDIIRRYENHPNVIVSFEADKGLYHARNKGILSASGEIISFLNTDDYYETDALHHLYNAFNNFPEIDVIYGTIDAVTKNGEFIKKYGDFEYNKDKQIREYIPLPDQATFIRSRHIPYIGLFDSTFSIIADWDFWLRGMTLNLKFKCIDEKIANYRHYEETLTFNSKFENIRFKEMKRLYRKYNDVCISKFLFSIYVYFYFKRPLKKIIWFEKIYRKIKN